MGAGGDSCPSSAPPMVTCLLFHGSGVLGSQCLAKGQISINTNKQPSVVYSPVIDVGLIEAMPRM